MKKLVYIFIMALLLVSCSDSLLVNKYDKNVNMELGGEKEKPVDIKKDSTSLCFTAKNGTVVVQFFINNVTHPIQYSTDGINWSDYTSNKEVTIYADQSIYFRAATNQTTAEAFGSESVNESSYFYFTSSSGGIVEGSGNIMSLYGPDCPDLPLQPSAFMYMFQNCTTLKTAPSLPATALASQCYARMFFNCASLEAVPELPATALAASCYAYMFHCCTSLRTAPSLPATTLASGCYQFMFCDCISLKTAPSLPATTLAFACYSNMFHGCTSLKTAPSLPATTLATRCYDYMFSGCTSLKTAPSLPATTLASECYCGMFHNCTSLKTAPSLPAKKLASYCYMGMFRGCTSLETVPELPATILEVHCYESMFAHCTSLVINKSAPGKEWIIPATSTETDALRGMFSSTSGTMNDTPSVNTTYYIASDPSYKYTTMKR